MLGGLSFSQIVEGVRFFGVRWEGGRSRLLRIRCGVPSFFLGVR